LSGSSIGKDGKPGNRQAAYGVDTTEVRSVLKAAKAMLAYTVKKQRGLETVIDYLEEKITGNEAIAVISDVVRTGRRRGKIRAEGVPFMREEGLRLSQLENARNARAAYAVSVSDAIQKEIRKDRRDLKIGHISLGKKYGYPVSVIRRILGAP